MVRKAPGGIERIAFALFFDAQEMTIKSTSRLANDSRYTDNMSPEGKINYKAWGAASFERYRVK